MTDVEKKTFEMQEKELKMRCVYAAKEILSAQKEGAPTIGEVEGVARTLYTWVSEKE